MTAAKKKETKAKADHSALVSKINAMLASGEPILESHCYEVSADMDAHREHCSDHPELVGCLPADLKWPPRKGLLIGTREFLEKVKMSLEAK